MLSKQDQSVKGFWQHFGLLDVRGALGEVPERRRLVAISAVGRVAAVAVADPVRPVRVALQEDVLEDVLVVGRLAVFILVDGVEGLAGGENGLVGGDSIGWESCKVYILMNCLIKLSLIRLDTGIGSAVLSQPNTIILGEVSNSARSLYHR